MIPNILWQSWKTKELPALLKKQSNSWLFSNPQLVKKFMDDEECSSFILQYFGQEIHIKYLQLPQPINRADFWRLAVVYIYGGYYADLDITCKMNLNYFINLKTDAVFIREINNIGNYFFGAKPKHPVIKMAIDRMLSETDNINKKESQSWGMHGLHQSVRDYYKVIGTNYISSNEVDFILDSHVRQNKYLIHSMASLDDLNEYESWRKREKVMIEERKQSHDILFFTTFNKNGYDLYGKTWVDSFIKVANYYDKFKAKIYYEGFFPKQDHPNIIWVDFSKQIPNHKQWKEEYLQKTTHQDYVKTMTVRFSHKGFVIQDVLSKHDNDYIIWLDGDCVYQDSDYTSFPKNILGKNFLACQLEHAQDLNHIESGILIFNGKHADTKVFNTHLKNNYKVDNVIQMGQPFDGFILYKSLITSKLSYTNLNQDFGKGGIQSDPGLTFLHPEIKNKFIHNIGWTGKNQYAGFDFIKNRDDIYIKMETVLFGSKKEKQLKRKRLFEKLEKLKKNKIK